MGNRIRSQPDAKLAFVEYVLSGILDSRDREGWMRHYMPRTYGMLCMGAAFPDGVSRARGGSVRSGVRSDG